MKNKKFLNNKELIDNIKSKRIAIKDEKTVKTVLQNNNYYVIMGYKTLFLKSDSSYKDNTNFEDVLRLYYFDRQLKMLLFDVLLDIENSLKVNIINQFCSKYGFIERDYLDKNNYNIHHKYLDKTLNKIREEISKRSYDSLAMEHYMRTYNYCPLWVAMKFLSFGVSREFFNILKDDDKFAIRDKMVIDKNISIKTYL